jgi:hypothetical protein
MHTVKLMSCFLATMKVSVLILNGQRFKTSYCSKMARTHRSKFWTVYTNVLRMTIRCLMSGTMDDRYRVHRQVNCLNVSNG